MAVPFAVVIPTRDRPEQLQVTVDVLRSQSFRDFEVVVVDQSDGAVDGALGPAGEGPRVSRVADPGTGLSRARNVGWHATTVEWVVFLDDDCRPEPGWAQTLERLLSQHPNVDFVSGYVDAGKPPPGDYVEVSSTPVTEERIVRGKWTRPWALGIGACMIAHRPMLEALEGFDERMGTGCRPFPAAEDQDFNHRLLRAGGSALVTPQLRTVHEQWRTRDELGPLYRDYMVGYCGFAIKQLRTGNVLAGVWLWWMGAWDAIRMLASAGRRRSWLRLQVALWKFRGLAWGTARALAYRW